MDVASIEARLDSLELNDRQLAKRVRYLEELIETRDSAWWKRLWWRLDGFPPWYRVGSRSGRPWHRFSRSRSR